MFGLIVLTTFALLAIFTPYIAPYNPMKMSSVAAGGYLVPPSWARFFNPSLSESEVFGLLGTDEIGRDIFSELLYGSRISLLIGFSAAFISLTIGTIIGLMAGFMGGVVDEVFMRITDVLLTIPQLPLLIVLAAVLGSSIYNLILVIGVLGWQSTARIIRSQVLSLKETPFIEASKAIGASDARIIFRILLPNVAPLIYVNATLNIAGVIFSETSLSFLGLGDPNHISWGMMLYFAHQYLAAMHGAWWYIIPPGICILLVIVSFIFVGHTLDEVLNPMLRRR
jgi:peptide/nickel transport system permease protein